MKGPGARTGQTTSSVSCLTKKGRGKETRTREPDASTGNSMPPERKGKN